MVALSTALCLGYPMPNKHVRKADKQAERAARRAAVAEEAAKRTCECPPWAPHLETCRVRKLEKLLEAARNKASKEKSETQSETQYQ